MNNLYKYPFPPQNYIAEEILLGMILVYPQIFSNIVSLLKADYFFLESHQIIYLHLTEIYKQNKLNPIELLYYLSKTKILYRIGGIYKILDIMKQSQTFIASTKLNIYIKELIQLINYYYIRRLMIQYGYNIIKLAYIPQISNHRLYNKASYYLNNTENQIPQNNKIKNFKELISNFLVKIQNNTVASKIINHNKKLLLSGFNGIDQLTSGLPKGDLIVIAGRPSMGKTSLAINIAYNIIDRSQIGVCIFSLEMSSNQVLNKLLSIACNISTHQLNLENININRWNQIKQECTNLLNCNIYINDTPNLSIDYIEYTAKLFQKEKNNIHLIIIDYLQLIYTNNLNNTTRTQELSYITRKLKLLAQALNIPIIILSQLNRNIDTRSNKEPLLSDLKDSGCINYIHNIYLYTYLNNSLNLINIANISNKFLNIKSLFNIQLKNDKPLIKNANQITIYIFMQYIFNCYIEIQSILSLTYNHKYLYHHKWIQIHHILDNGMMTTQAKNEIYTNNINSFQFNRYTKSYDLHTQKYFNFISQNIVLHNSIEQDADIIMMLYQKNNEQHETNCKKIVDIKLAKNRNGPIGHCELLFLAKSTKFNNAEKSRDLNSM